MNNNKRTALIVVDVQGYFLERSPEDLPGRIVRHIQANNYKCLAFTIFQNKNDSNWERSLHWEKSKAGHDIELASEFKELKSKDNVFIKTAYSAFKTEGFEDYLKAHSIEKVNLCGIDLEGCVLATAYEAFDLGYEVEVLFDLSHSRIGLEEAAKAIILRDIQTKN